MHPREEAAAAGKKQYEGAACRNCGGTTRYTMNATCVFCAKEKAKSRMREQRLHLKELMQQAQEAGQ
jgi:hypothetical protein